MTDSSALISIGQRDSVKIAGICMLAMIDLMIVTLAVVVIQASDTAVVARVVAVLALALLVGGAATWYLCRVIRARLEFSADGIRAVGIGSTQSIPMSAVRRVDTADGRTLHPRIIGDDGVTLYLPVIRLSVCPGDLPVAQLASESLRTAEQGADSVRWSLERAARPSSPLRRAAESMGNRGERG